MKTVKSNVRGSLCQRKGLILRDFREHGKSPQKSENDLSSPNGSRMQKSATNP